MKYSPEELVQIDCVEFTKIMCPKVLLIASMNGMYLGGIRNPAAYIAKMKKMGMRSGDLDIRLHWMGGYRGRTSDDDFDYPKTAYVELKAGKNKPTNEQKDMMECLERLCIPNGWTNTIVGYVALLKKFGVPMRSGLYAGVGQV
jgi:hypothetical protein